MTTIAAVSASTVKINRNAPLTQTPHNFLSHFLYFLVLLSPSYPTPHETERIKNGSQRDCLLCCCHFYCLYHWQWLNRNYCCHYPEFYCFLLQCSGLLLLPGFKLHLKTKKDLLSTACGKLYRSTVVFISWKNKRESEITNIGTMMVHCVSL